MNRLTQDAAAGVFLIVIAALALWQISDLPVGSLRQFGPAMLPRALAVITGLLGVVLIVKSLRRAPVRLDRFAVRGPIFVIGAAVAFAATVRVLGLSVAGVLVVLIGSFASPDIRPRETAIFAVVMTTACILLFKFALSLPIPVAPWLIGY
ncbi:MAG: tripartite tricarboxylate transporter TctB family protein [Alphaproteobacteria bacterium]